MAKGRITPSVTLLQTILPGECTFEPEPEGVHPEDRFVQLQQIRFNALHTERIKDIRHHTLQIKDIRHRLALRLPPTLPHTRLPHALLQSHEDDVRALTDLRDVLRSTTAMVDAYLAVPGGPRIFEGRKKSIRVGPRIFEGRKKSIRVGPDSGSDVDCPDVD
jgi:hypothetical protein